MREYTDNTRIANSKSPLIRHEPEFYYKWKANFLRNCRIGRVLKIKWIKNPYPTSVFSVGVLNGNESINKLYSIDGITDRLLILKETNGTSTSISFKDIYTKNNMKYFEWRD